MSNQQTIAAPVRGTRARRRALAVAGGLMAAALMLAGCASGPGNDVASLKGDKSTPTSHFSGSMEDQIKRANKCIADAGYQPMGGEGANGGAPAPKTSDGVEIKDPDQLEKYFKANNDCFTKYVDVKALPQADDGKFKEQMLALSKCIREHGYPTYPDPDFSNPNAAGVQIPNDIPATSPEFQDVQSKCVKDAGLGDGQSFTATSPAGK